MSPKPTKRYLGGLSINVILIGLISFLTDASSEMIVPILPLFLTEVLVAPMLIVGLLEGIAESTASILKALSGFWSDRVSKRAPFMTAGYSLSTVSKFLFAFSTIWQHVVGLKMLERVGKGIRSAPKDALLADSATPQTRGKVFGFHKAMDTAGAAVGVALALILVGALALGYRTIFLLSAIPAIIAVILIFFINEPRAAVSKPEKKKEPLLAGFKRFPRELKIFILAMGILSVTSVMTSFLVILSTESGATPVMAILFYLGFNLVYAGFSLPAGTFSDSAGRYPVILVGYGSLFAMFLVAALCNAVWMAFLAFLLYGLAYALTQGVQKALVADMAPADLRGSALGMYNMAIGIAALPMAIAGGYLWDAHGAWATFTFGATVSSVGLALLLWLAARKRVMGKALTRLP
ncbi:MAG: MFS transporter [Thermoplasmata archaeon]